jgi:heat shock protein HslJ
MFERISVYIRERLAPIPHVGILARAMMRHWRTVAFVALASGAAEGQAPVTAAQAALAAHPWQLVGFRGSDGQIFNPDDRSKYTLTFDQSGGVTVRVDCNQGHGSWTSARPGELRFEALAMTQTACPPGSLHDRIVSQWTSVRSYVVRRNGNLALSLAPNGGIFEFEPARVGASSP